MTVLLIDNFDSFTYNLYQYLGELADEVAVVRNNDIPIGQLRAGKFSHIVISPGPGNPTDPSYFGQNNQVIKEFQSKLPILGICLGHQGIAAYFGAQVVQAPAIMHGKTSRLKHRGQALFKDLPDEITVMRYHSLAVTGLPPELIIDAETDDGTIMAFHHQSLPIFGLQFHPESFLTETGKQILNNFLRQTPPKGPAQL